MAMLLQPKVTCAPSSRQGAGHLSCQTLLKVQLPGRIVGIGRSPDFHVSADGCVPCPDEENSMFTALVVRHKATEPPATRTGRGEVFGPHPAGRLVAVSPACPTP